MAHRGVSRSEIEYGREREVDRKDAPNEAARGIEHVEKGLR